MGQRITRILTVISLSISVFLLSFSTALASDESVEYGSVILEGDEYTINLLGTEESYDYQGATTMSVSNALGIVQFTNMLGQQLSTKNGFVTFDLDVPVTFSLAVERGYTYSGQIEFPVKIDLKDVDDASWNYRYWRFTLADVIEISDYENITVSYRNYTNINTTFEYGDVQLWLCFTLDNYQPSFTGNLYFNTMLHFESTMQVQTSIPANNTAVPALNLTATIPSDWAGTLYEYPTQVITDSTGSLITNQTQQQQQIANQQSQQSAQQHEDLKEGFTDNTYNNNVSNAGSQVDSYIDLEHNLLEQQNQQMSEYTDTAFNINTLSPYINAIALTSTFFTWIWNGFGELSVVFVIVLAIGVACLILGIRKRG